MTQAITKPVSRHKPRTQLQADVARTLFVAEYLRHINMDAGVAARRSQLVDLRATDKQAKDAGTRMLKDPKVQLMITEVARRRMERTEVSVDRVLAEYVQLAFVDIRDFLEFDGTSVKLRDWSQLPEGLTRAVASIEQEEYFDKDKSATVTRTKFKLHPKLAALKEIADYLRMGTPVPPGGNHQHVHFHGNGQPVETDPRARLAAKLGVILSGGTLPAAGVRAENGVALLERAPLLGDPEPQVWEVENEE